MKKSQIAFIPSPKFSADLSGFATDLAELMTEKDLAMLLADAEFFATASTAVCDSSMDDESYAHCMSGVIRVLSAASLGGLSDFEARTILRSIEAGIAPLDGSEGGNALAELCCCVVYHVGAGQMASLLSGTSVH